MTRDDLSAVDQLEVWAKLQNDWCEHKPSATVYVKDEEWMDVGSWVYRNFDALSGVSFLPHDGGSYKQAPYQEVTEEEYKAFLEKHPLPDIDWNDLRFYETEDSTTGTQELACTGGACEVVSIGNVLDG